MFISDTQLLLLQVLVHVGKMVQPLRTNGGVEKVVKETISNSECTDYYFHNCSGRPAFPLLQSVVNDLELLPADPGDPHTPGQGTQRKALKPSICFE